MNDQRAASDWMIYGANGYTGQLIAEEAANRSLRPTLAGRSEESIARLAEKLGMPARVFSLDDSTSIAGHLEGIQAVLNCAGPFSATAVPMMDACLEAGCHYLDITGEIEVILAGHERDEQAKAAGVSIIPAVGFDVVPTDCLAALLADTLPDATHLELAFYSASPMSPGTAKTVAENLHRGGMIRRNGELTPVPSAWKTKEIPFRSGPRSTVTIPWGDVASGYFSTGIPNIEVYMGTPESQIRWMRRLRPLLSLTGWRPLTRLLQWYIKRTVSGPSEEQRKTLGSSIWGQVTNASGSKVVGTIETLGGYPLTVETALASTCRILKGGVRVGYSTASQAFGKDFIREMPDTDVEIGTAATADETQATASM